MASIIESATGVSARTRRRQKLFDNNEKENDSNNHLKENSTKELPFSSKESSCVTLKGDNLQVVSDDLQAEQDNTIVCTQSEVSVTNNFSPESRRQYSTDVPGLESDCYPATEKQRRRKKKSKLSLRDVNPKHTVIETPITLALRQLSYSNLRNGEQTLDVGDASNSKCIANKDASSESHLGSKVYIQKANRFISKPRSDLTAVKDDYSIQSEGYNTTPLAGKFHPLDFGINSQAYFQRYAMFCSGLLAGMALWQCVTVYQLSNTITHGSLPGMHLVQHYTTLASPFQSVFYFLTIVCTVSTLDRFDVARLGWSDVKYLVLPDTGLMAMICYAASLVLSTAVAQTDTKMSLYRNETAEVLWPTTDALEEEVQTWLVLNLSRDVGVIFAWLVLCLWPRTGLLYEYLVSMKDFDVECGKGHGGASSVTKSFP